jgi:hypothetical protein
VEADLASFLLQSHLHPSSPGQVPLERLWISSPGPWELTDWQICAVDTIYRCAQLLLFSAVGGVAGAFISTPIYREETEALKEKDKASAMASWCWKDD